MSLKYLRLTVISLCLFVAVLASAMLQYSYFSLHQSKEIDQKNTEIARLYCQVKTLGGDPGPVSYRIECK